MVTLDPIIHRARNALGLRNRETDRLANIMSEGSDPTTPGIIAAKEGDP
jgi:hypothetical protein